MDTVKLSWSGGKDSTASAIIHGERGDKIKAVYYIPYLTDGIPLITRKQFDFMQEAIAVLSDRYDFHAFKARGISYYEHVTRVLTRGPRKGEIMGFGLGFGFCLFRDYSKRKAIEKCNVGLFDYEEIGIAFDETKRLNQLSAKKRSIIAANRMTESDCFELCARHGLLSPVYEYRGMRDGCVICPNCNDGRLREWAQDYPEGVEILKDIERICEGVGKGKIYRNGEKWSDRI